MPDTVSSKEVLACHTDATFHGAMGPTTRMTDAYEAAFAAISRLAADFATHESAYLSAGYSEAEVRKDFIDKFFAALGWDVDHHFQKNPYEQEVKVEKSVVERQSKRRADYAFFVAPHFRDVRFFVEAKKPSKDIDNADDCFQVVRYGWNSGVPLSVLTDFEQFLVLDCRYKPDIAQAQSRVVGELRFHYTQYSNRDIFDRIYWLFSREAVAADSIGKYVDTLPKGIGKTKQRGLFKQGVQSIDVVFLEELDGYRELLAKSFKNKNEHLGGEALTEVVQRTLDRLVFLRFLEDKLIESDIRIADFGKAGSAWKDFIAASRRLDHIYNGIVFKRHPILDDPLFAVDEKIISAICDEFSHDQSPYDFNVIPIHILGSIYERFLGSVITATDKRAKVEQKPEVRKAGGVYYTPDFVVQFIVRETVGKVVSGKSPLEMSRLRFGDISCGSGSFLLAVFDCLLRHHRDWYNANPAQARGTKGKKGEVPEVFKHEDGTLHLTLAKKAEILTNNIWGIDVDRQATEVAQLSLYLKLLEEETPGSARSYLQGFGGQLLPSLQQNIVCGNSLVGTDILAGQSFSSDEERKVNPLDVRTALPAVMERGGFDALVGNPPYIQLSMEEFRNPVVNEYLKARFGMAGGRLNTFVLFIERAKDLLKPKGMLGYIVPNTYASQEYYHESRLRLLRDMTITHVVEPQGQIFEDAVVETMIIVASKGVVSDASILFAAIQVNGELTKKVEARQSVLSENYKASLSTPVAPGMMKLRKKLEAQRLVFGDLMQFNQAIALKHDRAACLDDAPKTQQHRMVLDGRHISRYWTGESSNYFRFDLAKIHSCKREDIFLQKEKLFMRRVGDRIIASYDDTQKFALNTIVVVSPERNVGFDIKFLLGLLNSQVANFYYVTFLKSSKKVFSEIQARQVEQIPAPKVNLAHANVRKAHDRIVELVTQLIDSYKSIQNAKTEGEKDYLHRKILAGEGEVDRMFFDLYDLSVEERLLLQGASALGP